MIRQIMQAACVNQSCDASNVSAPHYTVGIRSGDSTLPCLVVRNQTTAVAGSYVISRVSILMTKSVMVLGNMCCNTLF
jgi:hypothetical protein